MVDVSKLNELTPEELKEIQSIISLFHLLGLTDEEISRLPQVLKNWPLVASNINAMAADLANVKSEVSRLSMPSVADSEDTNDNIRKSVGFGANPETVFFDMGGDKR